MTGHPVILTTVVRQVAWVDAADPWQALVLANPDAELLDTADILTESTTTDEPGLDDWALIYGDLIEGPAWACPACGRRCPSEVAHCRGPRAAWRVQHTARHAEAVTS